MRDRGRGFVAGDGVVWTLYLALAVAAFGCSDEPVEQQPAPECVEPGPDTAPGVTEALATIDGVAAGDFDAFVATSHAQMLLRTPEFITELDIAEEMGLRHDRLDDISDAYIEDGYVLAAEVLDRLRTFDREALTRKQKLTYDVYEWYLDEQVRHREFRHFEYPVTHFLGSVQNNLILFLRDVHPMDTRADAEDYVARLRQVGRKLDQLIELLEVARAQGVVAPRSLLEWSLPNISGMAAARADSVVLYTAYSDRLEDIAEFDEAERNTLRDAAELAIECHVIPGYQRLEAAVRGLMDSAPAGAGVGQYEGGDAFYEFALGRHTTTELTAEEIHQLGLDESARIQDEMRARFADLGYPPGESLADSFQRIIDDSPLIPAAGVVAEYERLIDEAEARLPDAFHRLPPTDVIVIGGPSGGFYVPGTPDGSRPGAFYARSIDPVPGYGMPTLTYHETVPGHHLQISLAQTLDQPSIHQATHFTAYIEGWALYAEQLAAELGWYADDIYGDLGRLQGEAFRAARLVVDTGLHARGWTFEEAVDFMVDNIGYGRPGMEGQVARYMAWPGQATAYKVGQLRLLELRAQAEQALGPDFDLRDFHGAVLDDGALPLVLLEAVVDDYIAANAPQP